MRRWLDNDSAELFASSEEGVVVNKKSGDLESVYGAVLCALRCDDRGGWKITKVRELTKSEASKFSDEPEAD